MNKERRKRIADIIEKLESLKDDIESVRDDEQEAYDNLPEGFQYSARGMDMEDKINTIDDAYADLETVIDSLNEVI